MPKVTMSSRVAAAPQALWQAIGGFGAIANWHPAISKGETEGTGTGSLRTLHLVGGGRLLERLEQVSDTERRYSYSLVDGPLPVKDYHAEISVSDNGDGTSTVEWTGSFEPAIPDQAGAVKTIEDIYRTGLDNMQKMFSVKM